MDNQTGLVKYAEEYVKSLYENKIELKGKLNGMELVFLKI
jgi:hypothetical protein